MFQRIAYVAVASMIVVGASACSAAPETRTSGGAAALSGSDGADHSCQVILRTAEQSIGRDGLEVDCQDTSGQSCFFVVRGNVDAAASYGAPGVLYRVDGGAWGNAAVEPSEIGSGYDFHFDAVPESSGSFQGSIIELIPFVTDASGDRLYDHNVVSDPYANYVLNDGDGFSVDNYAACGTTD